MAISPTNSSFVVYFKENNDKIINGGEPPRGKILYAVRPMSQYPNHPSAKPYPCIIGEFRWAADYHVNQMELSNPKQKGFFCLPIKQTALNKPESLLTTDDIIWSKIVSTHGRYYADTEQTAHKMCDLFQAKAACSNLTDAANKLKNMLQQTPATSNYHTSLTELCQHTQMLLDEIKQFHQGIYKQ